MPSPRGKQALQTGNDLTKTPPESLDDHGKKVWIWAIEVCAGAGRPLQQMHEEILVGLCQASSDVIEAGALIAREGYTIDGGREGKKRHPATSIRAQALTIKRSYLAELGLTPASASRLPSVSNAIPASKFGKFAQKTA